MPNKPDIVAPGSNLSYPISGGLYRGSGTSYAAPIVTGVVAQMINANSPMSPASIKAKLLLAADSSKISVNNNGLENSVVLREKSGAGFVNAIDAVTYSYDTPGYTVVDGMDFDTSRFYCQKGQKIRAILVFDKRNDQIITSYDTMDDYDLYLYNDSNVVQAQSLSTRNNVEIIEYTVQNSGYYYLRALSYRTADSMKWPYAAVTYKVF